VINVEVYYVIDYMGGQPRYCAGPFRHYNDAYAQLNIERSTYNSGGVNHGIIRTYMQGMEC
jgi:hypothetical protein